MAVRPDAREEGHIRGRPAIGNIIWVVLFGWELALAHLVTGIAQCITIIGIPLGLANFKLIPVSLLPMGREIVSVDEARRMGMESGLSVP